jgi:molecular chaperone HscB
MNYFEFYEIPVGFSPDRQQVKSKFYQLSKKYHPDFYINESEEKQNEVLELSTLNNKAFQTLSNPQKLLHYVLSLKGELAEGESYSLPQSFLMEMMEVNEAIMELEFEPDAHKISTIKNDITEIENTLSEQLKKQTEAFDMSGNADELKIIKDIYYRNKYLQRIKENISRLIQN